MKSKIAFFFILTILIPTSLLAYFGLLSVRNEKVIVEKGMRQKYEAMAGIIEEEIRTGLSETPEALLGDPDHWKSVLLKGADVFKDEVFLFDLAGHPLDNSQRELAQAGYARKAHNLPYIIAVYERHPNLLKNLEEKQEGLAFYISIIIFSVFSILGGSIFTLSALSREWRQARLKSEFTAHLSHDLKRPLTSIRMFSEMLKNDHVPSEEKKKEYYDIISEESDKLTNLANNILDFSRIEEGRRKYNIRDEDITRIVRETVERFKVYTAREAKNIKLTMDSPPSEADSKKNGGRPGYPVVRLDAGAISQALMNLLTNADKYSPGDGTIVVQVRNEKKHVVIDVGDQGEGISKAAQKKIFEKFYRALRKDVAEVEGSGLGLALVKYTAEAHGGKVKVDSQEGGGSIFSITLPM